AAVVMWRIDPLMTAVLFVPLLLSSWAMEVLGRTMMRLSAASRAATSRLTGVLGELLGAQLAIKVTGATPNAVARLVEMGDARRQAAVRDTAFGEMLESLSVNAVQVFGMGVILLLAAQAIRDGTFTVGDFALFVVYLDQLVWYPAEIARLLIDLKRTEVSFGRMRALVPGEASEALVVPAPLYFNGRQPTVEPAPERGRLIELSVHGLGYSHPGVERGIADVSFTLQRGSFTVITGKIGAGKTTLLHVLLGLLPRSCGEIVWNGQPVEDPARFFVPPRSAYTPQVPRLFSETLRENLLLGWEAEPWAVQRAIHSAVLERDVLGLEDELETLVGPRGVKLSGGQVQRAAAARMFVRDSELLVFDDLSSALDRETEALLWSRLFERAGDAT